MIIFLFIYLKLLRCVQPWQGSNCFSIVSTTIKKFYWKLLVEINLMGYDTDLLRLNWRRRQQASPNRQEQITNWHDLIRQSSNIFYVSSRPTIIKVKLNPYSGWQHYFTLKLTLRDAILPLSFKGSVRTAQLIYFVSVIKTSQWML